MYEHTCVNVCTCKTYPDFLELQTHSGTECAAPQQKHSMPCQVNPAKHWITKNKTKILFFLLMVSCQF